MGHLLLKQFRVKDCNLVHVGKIVIVFLEFYKAKSSVHYVKAFFLNIIFHL